MDIDSLNAAKLHFRWNPKHLRVLLTSEEIHKLPIRHITKEECYRRMRGITWNGAEWYADGALLLDGEWGYDEEARYVVVKRSQ